MIGSHLCLLPSSVSLLIKSVVRPQRKNDIYPHLQWGDCFPLGCSKSLNLSLTEGVLWVLSERKRWKSGYLQQCCVWYLGIKKKKEKQSFLLDKRLCWAATHAFKNDLLWCRSIHSAFSRSLSRKFFRVHPTGTLRRKWRKLQSFNITVCTLQRELNLINRALSDVLVQQEVVIYYHLHPQLCDLTGPAPFPSVHRCRGSSAPSTDRVW